MDNLTDNTTNVNQVGGLEKPEVGNNQPSGTEFQRTLNTCFRVLAAVQRNAIFQLMSAKDEEQTKRRAVEITDRLVKIANANGGEKCGNGTIWNPITGRCE